MLILELRDGKDFRETCYYAEPFEASEERAQWFERMERKTTSATFGEQPFHHSGA